MKLIETPTTTSTATATTTTSSSSSENMSPNQITTDSSVVVCETVSIVGHNGQNGDENSRKNIKISTIINGNENEHETTFCNDECSSSSTKTSPILSIRSHNISIESINGNEDDSSLASDSDSDYDIESIGKANLAIETKFGDGGSSSGSVGTDGIIVINQRNNSSNAVTASGTAPQPNIGSIAVQNSTDITFGNKTFYQGPVTIKQFIKDNNKWRQRDGEVNGGFQSSDGTINDDKLKTPEENLIGKKLLFSKRTWIITAITFVLAVSGITCLAVYLSNMDTPDKPGDGDDSRKNIPIISTIGDDLVEGIPTAIRLVSRSEWLAQPPNEELTNLHNPVSRVIIAHTATENCTTQAECTFRVRFIQTFHMESRHWDDIGYNFLVGGDGAAYEGRGWEKQGAHTKGYNTDSICIAFIGTFTKYEPPQRQLKVAQALIQYGIETKKIKPDFRLFGHRQLMASESPGEALYKIITTWPNWSKKLNDDDDDKK